MRFDRVIIPVNNMQIKMFQVDAFAAGLFKGNPAAVCLLENWLPNELMLSIAGENNLAETAFCIPHDDHAELKWFTPEVEIDLCGHATLATSHVLMRELGLYGNSIMFRTRSGELKVNREGGSYRLDFPSRPPSASSVPEVILKGIGGKPKEILKSRDHFFVFGSEKEVMDIRPDQRLLATINDAFAGIIVTAPGGDVDFVSRFFTPGASVFEDPVTGSAHCTLIPYWSAKLGKSKMKARQISPRGGELSCEDKGERVYISGKAITYLRGSIEI